jgi:hypothetical protein
VAGEAVNERWRRLAEAVDDLDDALLDAGVEIEPLAQGWRVTDGGVTQVQLRPLTAAEVRRLTAALKGTRE